MNFPESYLNLCLYCNEICMGEFTYTHTQTCIIWGSMELILNPIAITRVRFHFIQLMFMSVVINLPSIRLITSNKHWRNCVDSNLTYTSHSDCCFPWFPSVSTGEYRDYTFNRDLYYFLFPLYPK